MGGNGTSDRLVREGGCEKVTFAQRQEWHEEAAKPWATEDSGQWEQQWQKA